MTSTLQANIWKFYVYRVFASLSFSIPIFVLFLNENGLGMTQIMMLQAIYTIIIMVFEVPFGALGDMIGRKWMIIGSTFLSIAGWLVYSFGYSFKTFLVAEAILAISWAAYVGAGDAFLYDTLRQIGKEGSFKRIYGNVSAINYVVWGTAALIGAWLATYGLRIPIRMTALPFVVAFILSFMFTETREYKHAEKRYFVHIANAVKFTARHPRVRFFILFSAIAGAVWSALYFLNQPYLIAIKIPLVYFGVAYFFMNIAAAAGSKFANSIEEKLGERLTLFFLIFVPLISAAMMANLWAVAGVIFPIIIFFVGGFSEPVMRDYIHRHVESEHRATVQSLSGLMLDVVSAVTLPFIGWVFDVWSLSTALYVSAAMLTGNLILLGLVFIVKYRRERRLKREAIT